MDKITYDDHIAVTDHSPITFAGANKVKAVILPILRPEVTLLFHLFATKKHLF